MMAGSLTGLGSGVPFALSATPETTEVRIPMLQSENRFGGAGKVGKSITVEEYVRDYFSDIPILIEVARCESRFRQHDSEGGILRGEENFLDRGVMQINEYYHDEDSKKLGFDILTLEGNTAYARYLFEKYGVRPWKPSSRCWGKTAAYSEFIELAVNR